MRPDDFRQLLVKPGTLVGLIGSYGGPSEWSHGKLVQGKLRSYLVIERIHNSRKEIGEIEWDTAAIVSLLIPLETTGIGQKPPEKYFGSEVVLLHRSPDQAWDNDDPGVYVYGIRKGETLGEGPLTRSEWANKVVWLSDGALMTIEESSTLSPVAKLLRQRETQNREGGGA